MRAAPVGAGWRSPRGPVVRGVSIRGVEGRRKRYESGDTWRPEGEPVHGVHMQTAMNVKRSARNCLGLHAVFDPVGAKNRGIWPRVRLGCGFFDERCPPRRKERRGLRCGDDVYGKGISVGRLACGAANGIVPCACRRLVILTIAWTYRLLAWAAPPPVWSAPSSHPPNPSAMACPGEVASPPTPNAARRATPRSAAGSAAGAAPARRAYYLRPCGRL